MINKREKYLTFLLTFTLFVDFYTTDLNQPFLKALSELTLDTVLTLILTFMFYTLITRPVYEWVVRNFDM